AGCDLLTISPELLAQLAESDAPVQRAPDPAQARGLAIAEVTYGEAGFRYALNEDAMATEKLAEGIRAFAADAGKLDTRIETLRSAWRAATRRWPGPPGKATTRPMAASWTCAKPSRATRSASTPSRCRRPRSSPISR